MNEADPLDMTFAEIAVRLTVRRAKSIARGFIEAGYSDEQVAQELEKLEEHPITEAEARQAFWSGMVKLRRYFQTRPKLMATFKDLLRREAGLRPEKIRFRGGWTEDTIETEIRGTEEE